MNSSLEAAGMFALGVFGFLIIADSTGNWLLFVAFVLVSLAVYVFSLWRHPNRNCWGCRGTGRQGARFFGHAHRRCLTCNGTGQHRRLGSRVFGFREDGPRRV
jgi:hypothetical protein